jgi:predicted outer membrane protein
MKRGLNGKTFVISAALFTAVLFCAEAVEAQIFGNRGIFRNRGNNNCCVTPVHWNNCCPSYDYGYGYGGHGTYGGYTSYGINQGVTNWSGANPCNCDTYGTYTAGTAGYSGQTGSQSYNSSSGHDSKWNDQQGTYSTQQGYDQQGYAQQGYTQDNLQGTRTTDGNWSTQFSQNTDTGLTSPGNQLSSDSTIRSDQQPRLQSGNTGVAGNTTTQSQSHQVLSVRPDGTRTDNDGTRIDNQSNQNFESRDQYRTEQRPGDLRPGQNQYQPNRADGTQPPQQSEAYTQHLADYSPESLDKNMTCFMAKKFALHNKSASEMAEQIGDRLQSDDVKELAKTVGQDHADLADQFKKVATSHKAQANQSEDSTKDLGPYTSLYKMCEIADKNQQEQFEQMVSDLSEKEVDMGYIGTLMVCHRTMLAELEAARETLQNSELSSVIDTAIDRVRGHLEKAEEIYEDLKS